MKVSLNLAQQYSNVDLKSIPHDELVDRIGKQLGAVEEIKEFSARYQGVIVVKVVKCEKHPNADKLSLCMVDDGGVTPNVERGDDGLVQVVCGAPNVHTGMFASWIPPMATVPSTLDGDPFVLEARELRGKVSNGMLASPKELDISDEHEGILEITKEESGRQPKPGEPITNFYGLDDFVVDCENKMFTHRPDCFGNLGIAREIAGIFGLKFQSPDWYLAPSAQSKEQRAKSDGGLGLEVKNEITEKVPRFTVVSMSNVEIKPSNTHTQSLLKRVGIKPINSVVDVTNYVMHLTGQPLHAFDYDKLQKVSNSPSLFPRMAKKGEKITLLGNKHVELTEDDIVISTDKQAVALAGVMGGADTEVDENTKNIVVECANFDMYTIRRTSMRYGLFTDAVTRFNKGQSPLQNVAVINFALKNMTEFAGAVQASEVYDLTSFDSSADNLSHVETTIDFINERLGSSLTTQEVKVLLENVEFEVSLQGETLKITVPFWRMDVAIEEDIVEEVGRLYGYDKLPVILPSRTFKPTQRNESRDFAQHIRYALKESGANEVLTYSFVHGDLMRNTGTDPEKSAYHLRNALSPDLQYYRTSLMPSLLAKVHSNIKAQAGSDENQFALFEIGKAHVKGEKESEEPELPKQMKRLALVVAVDDKSAKKFSGSPYYQAKKYLESIIGGQATYLPLDTNKYPIVAPYKIGRSAIVEVNGQILGVVGELNAKAQKSLKLPNFCAGFEIDLDLLAENLEPVRYVPLSTFPETQQDITFEVEGDTKWAQLESLLHAELAVAKAESGYNYNIEALDIYQADDSKKKRISFRLCVTHPQKTLKTEEINTLLDNIAKATKEDLGAIRI